MPKKKDKQAKALEAIEKAIRKAAGKGVAVAAIKETVDKAVGAATETKPVKPKKAAKKAKAKKKQAKDKKPGEATESA